MRTANGSEKQPAIELFNFDTVMNTQYSEKPPNRTYTNKESEELRHLTFQNIDGFVEEQVSQLQVETACLSLNLEKNLNRRPLDSSAPICQRTSYLFQLTPCYQLC